MFKFPKYTDETLPYTREYDVNGGGWGNSQGKKFPGLIWHLVNKEQKASLSKQLKQIQQKWDKERRDR